MQVNFAAWANLLRYPASERYERIPDELTAIADGAPESTVHLEALRSYYDSHTGAALEETFVRTFENNAERALELGWHLHGESYARGIFMARMRQLLREHEIVETVELPDHISHILDVLDRADDDLSDALARGVVLPALAKIQDGFASEDNPYFGVIVGLIEQLETTYAQTEGGTDE